MKVLSKLKKMTLLVLSIVLSTMTTLAQNQERIYIQDLTVEPGNSEELYYMVVSLENGSDETYTAFQVDIELPAGLEVSYYDGEPEVYLPMSNHVYATDRRGNLLHTVAYNVVDNLIKIRCYSSTNEKFTKMTGDLLEIGLIPSAYLKPGDVEIKMHGVKFANISEQPGYSADLITSTAVKAVDKSTLSLKVSANNRFSTAVLPFDVAKIPTGLDVYSCNSTSGESLVLSKQQSIKAYTPYILYAANGYNGTLSGTVDASKYSETVADGYLTGTVVNQIISGGNGHYVMQNKGEGAMFYKVEDTEFAIPAGKCWLTLPAELQGSIAFRIDGATGIEDVKTENENEKTVFDLLGRKVENPANGIYIIDGKKIIIR